MEEIIKTLLMEGIDEDTIHRVLDVIEASINEYEYEGIDGSIRMLNDYKNAKIAKQKLEANRQRALAADKALDKLYPNGADPNKFRKALAKKK